MPTPRSTKNVSLTPELDRYVDALVASGRYGNASEVVRAGLRLLHAAEPDPASDVAAAAPSRARRISHASR